MSIQPPSKELSSRIVESINSVLYPKNDPVNAPLNVKKSSKKSQKVKKVKQSARTRDMEFSRLRGLRLVEYYDSEPFLLAHMHSRTPEHNAKRREIWSAITDKINNEFKLMSGFTMLEKDRVQKCTDYWLKRRNENQLLLIPTETNHDEPNGDDTVSQAPPQILTPPQTPAGDIDHLQEVREQSEKRELTNERLSFLVAHTNDLMKSKGLVGKSNERSFDINNLRNETWKQIQDAVNKKFPTLKSLNCSRVKKAFSNYKRRQRDAKKSPEPSVDVIEEEDVGMEVEDNDTKMEVAETSNDAPIVIDDGTIETFQDVMEYVKSIEMLKAVPKVE